MNEMDLIKMINLKLSKNNSITSKEYFILKSSIRLGNYYLVKTPIKNIDVGFLIWGNNFAACQGKPNYIGDFCTGNLKILIEFFYLPGWRTYCLKEVKDNVNLQCFGCQIIKKSVRNNRFDYLSRS